jgi:ribosomal protein S18 acetylase RimI-like enzyme
MRYRAATASDTEAVAGLHADSWQRTYRGAYADSFLDGDVMADRLSVWAERLAQPRSDSITIVAEADEEPAGEPAVLGFAHTFLDHDPVWGALLDNLHVSHGRARGGIGTRLMSETARELLRRDPGSDLYLWVLEQNTSGQAFYDARGGTCVGRERRGPFPGGGTAMGLRYAWPDPADLVIPR